MTDEKSCVGCGFGEELEELVEVKDLDNEGWWIHPLCLSVREQVKE